MAKKKQARKATRRTAKRTTKSPAKRAAVKKAARAAKPAKRTNRAAAKPRVKLAKSKKPALKRIVVKRTVKRVKVQTASREARSDKDQTAYYERIALSVVSGESSDRLNALHGSPDVDLESADFSFEEADKEAPAAEMSGDTPTRND